MVQEPIEIVGSPGTAVLAFSPEAKTASNEQDVNTHTFDRRQSLDVSYIGKSP